MKFEFNENVYHTEIVNEIFTLASFLNCGCCNVFPRHFPNQGLITIQVLK